MFPWLERIHQGVKSRVESPLVISSAASQRPIETQFHPSPARFARPLLFIWWIPLTCILCFARAGPCHGWSMVGGDVVAVPGCPCASAADRQSPVVALVQSGR